MQTSPSALQPLANILADLGVHPLPADQQAARAMRGEARVDVAATAIERLADDRAASTGSRQDLAALDESRREAVSELARAVPPGLRSRILSATRRTLADRRARVAS